MTFALPATRTLVFWLILIIVFLTFFQLLTLASLHFIDGDPLEEMRRIMDFDSENNIPTWYSSILLFIAAGLLALIAAGKSRDNYELHWSVLSGIFLFLSLDESAGIHEPLLFFYVPLVVIIGLAYLRFIFALPPKTRNLVILAAVLYVGGALVIEIINIRVAEAYGLVSFEYGIMVTIEEVLEMAGASLFIVALADYLHAYYQPRLSISLPQGQD